MQLAGKRRPMQAGKMHYNWPTPSLKPAYRGIKTPISGLRFPEEPMSRRGGDWIMYDVIIIGGSYSGLAAALQLARARRTVLIIDTGERRNRFAGHSHGFLGQDGQPP